LVRQVKQGILTLRVASLMFFPLHKLLTHIAASKQAGYADAWS
jgi:hypothetical protein